MDVVLTLVLEVARSECYFVAHCSAVALDGRHSDIVSVGVGCFVVRSCTLKYVVVLCSTE